MPRILLLGGLALALGGCAVQADRTRDLLELDLADREAAMARLAADDRAEPTAWRAYSLGALHAAADDFAGMARWFAACRERSDLYDARIASVRRDSWRRWARRADEAFAAGRWADCERACALALAAEGGHPDTELRAREARVMADGPTAGDIVALVEARRTAVLDRWLEDVADPAAAYVALAAEAPPGGGNPAAALTHFILAELAWAAEAPAGLAAHAALAADRLDDHRRAVLAATCRQAHDLALQAALSAWADGNDGGARRQLALAARLEPGDRQAAVARQTMTRLAAGDFAGIPTDWILTWADRLAAAGRDREAAAAAAHVLDPRAGATAEQRRAAHLRRATSLAAVGDAAGAAAALASLLETDGAGDAHSAAELSLALGDLLMASSRWEAAARWYERAAADAEPTAELALRRARAAFGAGRWQALRLHAAAAVELAPADPEARRLLEQADSLAAAGEGTP